MGARLGITAQGETANDGILWSSQRDGVYQPTPLAYDGLLYMLRGNGVLSCYDIVDGRRLYRERVASRGSEHTASMVAADGYLYLTSESGEIYVIRAGEEMEVVAINPLEDNVLASPAISNGCLVFRTLDELVAVSHR